MRVVGLRCEYRDEPLGLCEPLPRLAWRLESDERDAAQRAYQVLAASNPELLAAGTGDLWDSGHVDSRQSTQVVYAGAPLGSRRHVWWQVRVWDQLDRPTAFSAPAHFSLGLLAREDWQAQAIGASAPPPADLVRAELDLTADRWCWLPERAGGEAVFRRRLTLPANQRLRAAEFLLAADAEFALAVNGELADTSDAPPDTWIHAKLCDLRRLLGPGENTLAIRATGEAGRCGVLGRLRLTFESGETLDVPVDREWRAQAGPVDRWASYALDDFAWPAAAEYEGWSAEPHPQLGVHSVPQPCPYLRREFRVDGEVARATVYASALGLYELHLNGHRVSPDVLTPGWTEYTRRLPYQTYDVTSHVRPGANALGAVLADGWYAGHLAHLHAVYGTEKRLIVQLEVELTDGRRQVVTSDDAWCAGWGALQYADLVQGEAYDARRRLVGWAEPGFVARDWEPVVVEPLPDVPLEAHRGVPVRRIRELTPLSVSQPTPGRWVFDLGQNIVGWVRLRLQAPAGTTVRLRYGEMLNPDGTVYLTNLRSARALDTYVCAGRGTEVWEPRFTFHGFRYVEVRGLPGTPAKDLLTGVMVHSQLEQTGTFDCSDPLLRQLQHNIEWGQRGNYLEVPTDCPQRDERLGWTGDTQVYAATGCFNFDAAAFLAKWLVDLEDGQDPAGWFPFVAPAVGLGGYSSAWADAGVIVPWTLYRRYGDERVLARHYPAMLRWLEFQQRESPELIRPANGFGDWLQLDADTPREVLQTAFFAWSATLLAAIAQVLGRPDDASRFGQLAADIRAAFGRAFVAEDGRIHGDTQCVYALALAFDLLPEAGRPAAVAHLAARLADRDGLLSTGFVGTPYLCDALTRGGRADLAYALVREERFPSWGYSIRCGATTMWERWDGWTAERGFQTPHMNSFNHYAYGAVGAWLYETVAGLGLADDARGYDHVRIAPLPGGGLTWAKASLRSPYGLIATGWELNDGRLLLDVTLPPNCRATVVVPTSEPGAIVEAGGAQPEEEGGQVFTVGAGRYRFTAPA